MIYKKEKVEAFKLFAKGWTAPDVRDYLGVPERTTQRWYVEYEKVHKPEQKIKQQESGKDSKISLADVDFDVSRNEKEKKPALDSKRTDNQDNNNCIIANVEKIENDWENTASKLALEHLIIHANIRRKLAELLTQQIEADELNIRGIQILSNAVCRHTEIERQTASLDYLDINKAIAIVVKHGLSVVAHGGKSGEEDGLESLLIGFNSAE